MDNIINFRTKQSLVKSYVTDIVELLYRNSQEGKVFVYSCDRYMKSPEKLLFAKGNTSTELPGRFRYYDVDVVNFLLKSYLF
jgi:hypothetical protein